MSAYDEIAEWYDSWVGTHSLHDDPYFQPVESLLGEVAEQRICDLACGQGRVARHLADLGARVVGIDISAQLLAIARRYEETSPRGIEYHQADAQRLTSETTGIFDGVVCFMALMDIPDLAGTLRSVANLLRPEGWFAFSILHPCFNTSQSGEIESSAGAFRTVSRYFVEGYWRSDTRPGPPGKVGAYHRTLSTYVNDLADAGLQLVRLSEPRVSADLPRSPSLSGSSRLVWAEVPPILVALCRKRTLSLGI
ncbi:MAG TPA: class I SAM-dependent methyltransferase [Ktedonobacterales bacterium]|nr:class I SAM-dependent methyltransferase [Ktedonobacterales bacterium]